MIILEVNFVLLFQSHDLQWTIGYHYRLASN